LLQNLGDEMMANNSLSRNLDQLQRILVVEDDPDMLGLVSRVLAKRFPAAEVIEISNGLDALERLTGSIPDLLILDICLPGVDGFEILSKTRTSVAKRALKVLAISGYADKLVRARQLGSEEILAKPFTANELTLAIEALFDMGENFAVTMEENNEGKQS